MIRLYYMSSLVARLQRFFETFLQSLNLFALFHEFLFVCKLFHDCILKEIKYLLTSLLQSTTEHIS